MLRVKKAYSNKIVAKKRTVEEQKNMFKPIIQLVDRPIIMEIKAYLCDDNRCYFYDKISPTKDYFYKCLVTLVKQHKELVCVSDYKEPFNKQSFKFNYKKHTCYDKGRRVGIGSCHGKPVKLNLKLITYDFTKEKRIVGLNIKVDNITVIN